MYALTRRSRPPGWCPWCATCAGSGRPRSTCASSPADGWTAYVERGLKPWDLAAGSLIAQEAGARVAGLRGAEAVGTDRGRGLREAVPDLRGRPCSRPAIGDWPMPSWPG